MDADILLREQDHLSSEKIRRENSKRRSVLVSKEQQDSPWLAECVDWPQSRNENTLSTLSDALDDCDRLDNQLKVLRDFCGVACSYSKSREASPPSGKPTHASDSRAVEVETGKQDLLIPGKQSSADVATPWTQRLLPVGSLQTPYLQPWYLPPFSPLYAPPTFWTMCSPYRFPPFYGYQQVNLSGNQSTAAPTNAGTNWHAGTTDSKTNVNNALEPGKSNNPDDQSRRNKNPKETGNKLLGGRSKSCPTSDDERRKKRIEASRICRAKAKLKEEILKKECLEKREFLKNLKREASVIAASLTDFYGHTASCPIAKALLHEAYSIDVESPSEQHKNCERRLCTQRLNDRGGQSQT